MALALLSGAGCDGLFDDDPWRIDRIEISGDTNEDGHLNPGESATVEVFLTGGEGDGYAARALVTTDSPGVSVDAHSPSARGGTGETMVRFPVTIEQTVPAGSSVSFVVELSFSNGSGEGAALAFTVPLDETGAIPAIAAVTVSGDDNNDGIANKSETVTLVIDLENRGTSGLPGVEAVLLSADSLLTVTRDQARYWDIDVGDTSRNIGSSFRLEIDAATPAGHAAKLSLQVVDSLGNDWILPVNLTVHATGALITFSRKEIEDDGNSDGVLDAGESARLTVWIKNGGTSQALGLRTVVSTADPLLTVTSGSEGLNYWRLEPGEESRGSGSRFGIEAAEETPEGHVFELFLTITDDQANAWTDRFVITEGAEELELTLEDWEVDEVGGDGDGTLSAGEVGRMSIVIRNAGTVTAREVDATLSSEDPHVRIDAGRVRVGNVGVNGTAPAESPFRFTVLASHPDEPLEMEVTLSSGRYERVTRVSVPLGKSR